jgi:uncharacterized protein (DUF2252 family)
MTDAIEPRSLVDAATQSLPSVARADRRAAGAALRSRVPRSLHGDWRPEPDRADPIALLERQNASRLPDLVPIRYGRMMASPFAFLRGSAAVMAQDLAHTPVSGITVQACGDAHILNFGIFATRERNIVFGMNDFDETAPGPWEWDVKRMVASAAVAARFLGHSDATAADAARAAARSYRMRMEEFSHLGNLDLWYMPELTLDAIVDVLSPEVHRTARTLVRKARKRTNIQVLEKMTERVDGHLRIVEQPPLIVRPTALSRERSVEDVLVEWLNGYRSSLTSDRLQLLDRYRIVDAVRKVVGVGSVGTRCYVIHLRGDNERDPLFLQVKEAQASVLAPFVALRTRNQGRRVVEGQRLIQPAPDIFLGWGSVKMLAGDRVDYYVRQLRDMKGSVSLVPGTTAARALVEYSGLCGWALAKAHARSGDAASIAGYLGRGDRFDKAMTRFAIAYADQTERDYAALVAAVADGRIEAISDGGT